MAKISIETAIWMIDNLDGVGAAERVTKQYGIPKGYNIATTLRGAADRGFLKKSDVTTREVNDYNLNTISRFKYTITHLGKKHIAEHSHLVQSVKAVQALPPKTPNSTTPAAVMPTTKSAGAAIGALTDILQEADEMRALIQQIHVLTGSFLQQQQEEVDDERPPKSDTE